MTATMELYELTASARDTAELIEWNRALRDHLARQDPQVAATTEINGGDLVVIVDEDDKPQTVAQVMAEIDEFLVNEAEIMVTQKLFAEIVALPECDEAE